MLKMKNNHIELLVFTLITLAFIIMIMVAMIVLRRMNAPWWAIIFPLLFTPRAKWDTPKETDNIEKPET